MNVMKRAWEIYRTLEGDKLAKLSMSLKQAWSEKRGVKMEWSRVNVRELEAFKKLKEEGQENSIWWNKRIKKLELAGDLETIKAANMLKDGINVVAEIKKSEFKNKYGKIEIVTKKSHGNIIVKGEHKVLNVRLDRNDWEKVKHCFKFINTTEINDEAWGETFVGYEIVNETELRKILNF